MIEPDLHLVISIKQVSIIDAEKYQFHYLQYVVCFKQTQQLIRNVFDKNVSVTETDGYLDYYISIVT